MTYLGNTIDMSSENFRRNEAVNRALAEQLRARVASTSLGGPEPIRARHVARGKLLPRDRVERLLDPGSPFLEIGQLAANGMYDDDAPGRRADLRHRPSQRPRGDDRRQRRHRERRRLFPHDGEETPAGAGNRARKPPALHLSGR